MDPAHARLHEELATKHRPILTLDEAMIREGMPVRPFQDLYYNMLEGSWLLVLCVFGISYILANVVFALLYLAGGDCIVGATPGSFADAFFFSVETLSTIGYGGLMPKTRYAELVMTAEAMTGVLGVALATGLIFAKFSRPNAKLAFSKNLMLSPYDGLPSLYFRVANIRGNDVVEASVGLAVAIDRVTREGHTLRRLEQLKLVRANTPLFRMSWLVIHVIDEDSPLFGMSLEDFYSGRILFIVTLTGMDGTFAQIVQARHLYRPADIAVDHHFEDIISLEDDGRLRFNYHAFDDIRPLHDHERGSKSDDSEAPSASPPDR